MRGRTLVTNGSMRADCDLEMGVPECGCRRDEGTSDAVLSGRELAGVTVGSRSGARLRGTGMDSGDGIRERG